MLSTEETLQTTKPVKSKRMHSLDLLKCCAAFFVVYIHFGPTLGYDRALIRCAVPLFFMVSGYYYPVIVERGHFKSHMVKLLLMLLFCSVFSRIFFFLEETDLSVDYRLSVCFDIKQILTDIRLGSCTGPLLSYTYHIWYFYAVIYATLVIYIADRLHLMKFLHHLSALLMVCFFIGNFLHVPYFETLIYWTRNFLFLGIPLMMMGRSIRTGEDQLFVFFAQKNACPCFVTLGIIGSLFEYGFIKAHTELYDWPERDMYIFTTTMIVPIFYLALRHPKCGKGSIFAKIGNQLSPYIFIVHVVIGEYLRRKLGVENGLLMVVEVFVLSCIVSALYVACKHFVIRQLAKRKALKA